MKHLSIRFAWHDNKWNGKFCKNPSENVYCVDNYSLLSSRISRRRDVKLENKFGNKRLSNTIPRYDYTPPCYWCINALGNKKYKIKDLHPFCDTWKRFEGVPPIKNTLKPFSVFTWNFDLSFNTTGNYKYPPDLEDRVEKYINKIKPYKSIAFFYANYSNPITGDERKYLILGAGLVREHIKFPQSFDFEEELYKWANKDRPVFPKIAWQYQIPLDPETTFILPYHEYLEWKEQDDNIDLGKKDNYLDEIVVRVDDFTIEPHFKYVSMHVPHDKAIFLLYKIKKSIKKIKAHGLIPIEQIKDLEKKLEKLLNIAWEQRNEYPGFRNLIEVLLKNDFDDENDLESVINIIEELYTSNFKSVDIFLGNKKNIDRVLANSGEAKNALKAIKRQFKLISYLSRFNFSTTQFENVLNIISNRGIDEFITNPYSLLEEYPYDLKYDDWKIENNDYGISIYQLDIALIPDHKYVKWDKIYDSHSLERVRALITKILYDAALNDGHSYLSREELLEEIKEYPLYYIQREYKLDQILLNEYENDPRFKELFKVKRIEGQTVYQLKSLEKIEKIIENFVYSLQKKKVAYDLSNIDSLMKRDFKIFKKQLQRNEIIGKFIKERTELYKKVLKPGLTVISGKAGSGKTSAIISLVQEFKKQKKEPIFLFTPTGKASLVIRNRLKEIGLHNYPGIKISTIHWFIYGALLDSGTKLNKKRLDDIFDLIDIASKIFEGNYHLINTFEKKARRLQFNPQVVIIDEASMADEITFSLLFCMINPSSLKHLIIIGDDKQLPPIGVGRPFIDLLYYLKNRELEDRYQHLTINLRFASEDNYDTKIELLADLFRSKEEFTPNEINEIISSSDNTLEIKYFKDAQQLRDILREILLDISDEEDNMDSLQQIFMNIFEGQGEFEYENLEKVQLICPKRIGKYGTLAINRRVILENLKRTGITPGSKIICEENQYWKIKGKRMLALANGSLGYYMKNTYLKFADIDELIGIYDNDGKAISQIINRVKKIRNVLWRPKDSYDNPITLAYAITVHKSQGSDFNHVFFVLSEHSSFITRELLYTGFTRIKNKIHLLIQEDLMDDLYKLFLQAYNNSAVEKIHTLLFGHKISPYRPYLIHLSNGEKIGVDSKIEYIIAKTLDNLGIEFEHGTEEFHDYHIKPDFKIYLDSGTYYWEHLGLLSKQRYKNRWFYKLNIYKQIGIDDILITSSESIEYTGDVETIVKEIVNDMKAGSLKYTEGSYSKHHYEI